MIELANKKRYSKCKFVEDDEASKIYTRMERRKKNLVSKPIKNSESTQSDENTPKNIDSVNLKHSSNLLKYFSKTTPEQVEKERIAKAKVIVKAEVHTLQNSSICINSSSEITNDILKGMKKSNFKQSQKNFDEIILIQSETLIQSPKNEKLKSSLQHNKPKWSLKVQLQSNNSSTSDLMIDEEVYTPTATKSYKRNIESNDKIPKILLPIKNRKSDTDNSLFDVHLSKTKKKDYETINVQTVKTESLNAETNKQSNGSKILSQCQFSNINSEKVNAGDDCQIIKENCLKRKSKEKLAPLFTKRMKPNLEIITARRLFLQSDMYENNDISHKKKTMPIGSAILPFPKISHVKNILSNTIIVNQVPTFLLKDNERIKLSLDLSHMKIVHKIDNSKYNSDVFYECVKSDVETTLSEIESYFPDVRTLWKSIYMVSQFESPTKILKNKKRLLNKKNCKLLNDNLKNESLYSPWTDKYRPNSCAEVICNEEAVLKLKTWLDGWKSSKNNEDSSSGEEFYISDCSMTSSKEINQVAVLVGPHGSGKTASVYAIAQELNYKVLEVNASSKRPGKKILKDFEEATKSHRIKKSNLKDAFATSTKVEESKENSQKSLVLIEDVDLIFEEDEGFISATYQLASYTKRPIVMTLTQTCSYLSKMAPHQLRINFQSVNSKRASALLQLIGLAETGHKLSQSCAYALCKNGDLRKGLLQLQYLLQSRKNCVGISSLAMLNNNTSWENIQTHIYKPIIEAAKNKKEKKSSDENPQNNIFDLVHSLDSFSLTSTLINVEDRTYDLLELNWEPSISLVENENSYCNIENTSNEIGNWLNDAIIKLNSNNSKKLNNLIELNKYHLLTKERMNTGIDAVLSQIVSNTLDRRALAVDYLSSIRAICRAEEIRNQLNNKRGNRFFHYLQSSRLTTSSMKSNNILFAACKILQENSVTISESAVC